MTAAAPAPAQDDLVDRLRDIPAPEYDQGKPTCTYVESVIIEAADHIEAQAATIAELNSALDMVAAERDAFHKSQDYWMTSASDERLRAERAESALAAAQANAEEVTRPLDAQMSRLNENLIAANKENRKAAARIEAQAATIAELEETFDTLRGNAKYQQARAERAEDTLAAAQAALDRADGCIRGLIAQRPVRDVTETLAEIDAARSAK